MLWALPVGYILLARCRWLAVVGNMLVVLCCWLWVGGFMLLVTLRCFYVVGYMLLVMCVLLVSMCFRFGFGLVPIWFRIGFYVGCDLAPSMFQCGFDLASAWSR